MSWLMSKVVGATRCWTRRSIFSMTVTDDGSTIVALHPAPKRPYEQTQPLPESGVQDSTALRLRLQEARQVLGSAPTPMQARQRLARVTLTTEHRWYPRSRDRRAKKTPMDRPYL